MLYILDANVLIDANRDYYNLDRIPEFWDWLIHQGENENIKVPLEIAEEIREGNDGLAEWLRRKDVSAALVLREESDPARVTTVVNDGYADDITDDELKKLGRDPPMPWRSPARDASSRPRSPNPAANGPTGTFPTCATTFESGPVTRSK